MVLYALINGQWRMTTKVDDDGRNSYLIVCDYGDWSGFRTLNECLAQVPESWPNRRPGFYRIERR